jgi:hypothetical protein
MELASWFMVIELPAETVFMAACEPVAMSDGKLTSQRCEA